MWIKGLGSLRVVALAGLTAGWIGACSGGTSGGSGCAPDFDFELPVISIPLPPAAAVDAGEGQVVRVGDEVTLFAVTEDSGVEWRFLSRPPDSESELEDATSAMTTFVADRVGVYELEVLSGWFRGSLDAGTIEESPPVIARDVVTVVALPQLPEPCGGIPDGASVTEDEGFSDDDWEVTAFEPDGASVRSIVDGSPSHGVDDGAFRVMIDIITNPDLTHPECNEPPPEDASCSFELVVFHGYVAPESTYDIATDGPIAAIDYLEHQRIRVSSVPDPDLGWAPAILQADQLYNLPIEKVDPDGQWRQVVRCGLRAEDFIPAGLDFENGEALTFGYVRTLTNTDPDSELRVDHAIGSFKFVVSPR